MNNFPALLYRRECFTGKCTTRKIHTKLCPGPEWRIFHILTSVDIDDIISHFFTPGCLCKQSKMASSRFVKFSENGVKFFCQEQENVSTKKIGLDDVYLHYCNVSLSAPFMENKKYWNSE